VAVFPSLLLGPRRNDNRRLAVQVQLALTLVIAIFAALAALFSVLGYLRSPRSATNGPNSEQLGQLLRGESDRIRQAGDDQARELRAELASNLTRFQQANLGFFGELRGGIELRVTNFCDTVEKGMQEAEIRGSAVASKLDEGLAQVFREATANRDVLRQTVDEKLDEAIERQALTARNLREEIMGGFGKLGDTLRGDLGQFGSRLDRGVAAIDERAAAISTKLDQDLARMGEEAHANRDSLKQTIDQRLNQASIAQVTAAKELREEITDSFRGLGNTVTASLDGIGQHQKERLENVASALLMLTQNQGRSQEALKQAVESRLDAMRNENSMKLDEMRRTVDEKLQTTLEARLGESFDRVVEQLERVHKGIGEMQTLAAGVGDLKRVLSNVRIRGTYGEVQLAMLLEQFLSPEQYVKNAQIKEGSQERVEFAIRLPGREGQSEVLLPVDAKFPHEDYARLVAASEAGDSEEVARATKDLENRIKQCAKTIREKYISTPRTTDFGILFLPTESLFAEVLRRPGFFEQVQVEYHVTLAGPTTLTALLNALQMGFRSLAIEQRSSEVWRILGAVKTEFGKYNDVVDGLSRQLSTAARSVESLGVRTRAMSKKLRDVEKLPEDTAQIILGPELAETEDIDEEVAMGADPSGPK
jgi:DNA recombination protein RmuC